NVKKLLLYIFVCFTTIQIHAQSPELWGMTFSGGINNVGTIFKTDSNGNNHVLVHEFIKYEGAFPKYTELCEASNGKLYGMTREGGANEMGVLFEYEPSTNTYSKKLDFNGAANGRKPYGSLIQASNGKLYGMTSEGGTNDMGVLFEYDPTTSTYTKKLDFNDIDGSYPQGSLMQASNGKLYGMTLGGGTNNFGVLFEYNPSTNTYTKKFDFNSTNGGEPYGSLMQASNGKLYGMTRGGINDIGVLFEFDPTTSTYTKKLDFNYIDGQYPFGSLMQASNGKLYGMTEVGGTNGMGVLFEYDPTTSTYTKKLDFNDIDGQYPFGSLMQASNGKLYGMTPEGGTNDMGVLFEYHPTTNTYTKKLDFNGINGISPNGDLIEVTTNVIGIKEQITNNIKIYPNPSKGILYIETEQKQKFELYNSFGEMVYVHQLQIGKNNLKLPNLATGVYYIKLFNKSTTIVERLMIHHQ
ncbi:MAG: T9SS type A sorting domain-containing protein, partial [Flavobacteriales bacterium]|nr:T9SS type A sorting domain-containing protein [Flavobacteriales bacterium]